MRGQHPDGDGAIQAGVGSFVHFPHASSTKWGLDFVETEPRPRGKRHDSIGGHEALELLEPVLHPNEGTPGDFIPGPGVPHHQEPPVVLAHVVQEELVVVCSLSTISRLGELGSLRYLVWRQTRGCFQTTAEVEEGGQGCNLPNCTFVPADGP